MGGRSAARERGQECKLASGLSVLVYPNQYSAILPVIGKLDLQPHHVIIAESFFPLLMEEVRRIPCRRKVKLTSFCALAYIDSTDMSSLVVDVNNTFINTMEHF